MPLKCLRTALLELSEEYAARAARLEEEAARHPEARGGHVDPVMEARRQRRLAEDAREIANSIRF